MRIGIRRWWCQCYTIPKNSLPSPLYYHTQTKPHSINNTLLKELVQSGQFIQALEYYTKHWNTSNFRPDNYTFPYILKASTQLKDPTLGLLIHNIAIKTGFGSNLFVSNSLILFYGKFGKLEYISYLFDEMPQRNIVTWTAAISALLQNYEYYQAVRFFRDMLVAGIKPNSFTMATILPCFCYMEGSIQIHGFLIKHGFESDVFVLTALIDVYAKCGFIFSAQQVFNEMPERNVVSWNAMILGYNQNGEAGVSLRLFSKMRNSGDIQPDSFSVVTALNSCSSLTAL
ncbi:Pentatricopeptide repeat-containing protein, partial [Thalictrum thalictroides]